MAKDLRWESLLSKAPAVSSMVRPARGELLNGTQSSIAKGTEVIPRLGGEGGKIGQEARVVKRTWVAMAKDAPVYDLGWFRNGMRGVREREVDCSRLGPRQSHEDSSCWRRFSNLGHFESLIAVSHPDSPSEKANATGWRYTPFLTSSMGVVRNQDLVTLPNRTLLPNEDVNSTEVESDFSYDWEISFSTVSPLKLAIGSDASEMMMNSLAEDANFLPDGDDWVDTTNSLLGHPSTPRTRPLLRVFLALVIAFLSTATACLDFYYWWTRSLTTGIAIPSRLIDVSFDVLSAFVLLASTSFGDFISWLGLGYQLALFSIQWSLGLRLEWTWRGPWGLIPVRVERRRPTRREKKSSRLDVTGFSWTLRGLLFLATFLVWNYLPTPHLISSPSSLLPPPTPNLNPYEGSLFASPFVVSTINSLLAPLWISLYVPQLLLNHRSSTFAGSHRLGSILYFVEEVLALVPRLLSVGGEKWESMEPVRVYDVVGLVVVGTMAWQALTLEVVKQEEGEEEED
ncbi:hypothetical protein BDY24DRAFT_369588 [Mrakia frigida]|uniref:uncharacterized protein n=1 Tax=Mrakia frigida TaxID=29902 RepID=UPI003FCBF11F